MSAHTPGAPKGTKPWNAGKNNRIRNLEVLTVGEHTVLHHTGKRKSYDTRRTIEGMANMREEIKRLRAINAELLKALQAWVAGCGDERFSTKEECRDLINHSGTIIAKALGNK